MDKVARFLHPHRLHAIQHLGPSLYVSCYFGMGLGTAMLIPALLAFLQQDPTWAVFLRSGAIVFGLSLIGASALRQPMPEFSLRFAFLLTSTLWVVAAAFGAVPFLGAPLRLTVAEAFFESMSGLTTTGATVLTGLDMMPRSLLLWRSLLQWFGGIGIIGIGLFLFPFLRIGGMQFFRTESSDRSDKTIPRIAQLTRTLIFIYVGLTFLCALFYAALGMSVFDAVNHAMTTISTGGFSTHDQSFGFFHDSRVLWAATFFMAAGSLPFVLYAELLVRGRWGLFTDAQVRVFLTGIAAFSVLMTIWLAATRDIPLPTGLTQSAFNIVSVVTTTGFASQDYALWGPFALAVFFILTFIGGCSGSTTGGIKIYRFIILWRAIRSMLMQLLYPHAVAPLKYSGRVVERDVFESVTAFMLCYLAVFGGAILILALLGIDFITAVTGAVTALSNVGPGLGETIGPSGNFQTLNDGATWLLSFIMLLGRLEIMTVLVLFSPAFWAD